MKSPGFPGILCSPAAAFALFLRLPFFYCVPFFCGIISWIDKGDIRHELGAVGAQTQVIGAPVRRHDKACVKAHILRFYNKMLNLICPGPGNGRLHRPARISHVDVIDLFSRL